MPKLAELQVFRGGWYQLQAVRESCPSPPTPLKLRNYEVLAVRWEDGRIRVPLAFACLHASSHTKFPPVLGVGYALSPLDDRGASANEPEFKCVSDLGIFDFCQVDISEMLRLVNGWLFSHRCAVAFPQSAGQRPTLRRSHHAQWLEDPDPSH